VIGPCKTGVTSSAVEKDGLSVGLDWIVRRFQRQSVWFYWTFLYVSLATLALIGVTMVLVARRPDEGLFWGLDGNITEVTPDGPGAAADVRVGDVLVALDDVPEVSASYLYERKKPGSTVVLSMLRDGEPYTVEVRLRVAPFRVTLRRLEPLFIALSFWLVGAATALLKPTLRTSQLFALCAQAGAGVLASGVLSSLNAPFGIRLFNFLLCALAPLLVHFHLVFPMPRGFPARRLVVGCAYGLGLLFSLPYILLAPAQSESPMWHLLWRSGVRAFFVLSALLSVVLLFQSYLAASEHRIRRQVRLVVLGTAWAFVPVTLLSILPEMLAGSVLVSYPVTFLSLPLIPVVYALAVYRYNLMGIDRFLSRSVVHFALGALWVLVYLAFTVAINVIVRSDTFARRLVDALVALVLALVLFPLRGTLQNVTDRLFYGGWYDYRSVVTDVSAVLSETQDEMTLVEQLVHRLAAVMGLRGAALFLAHEEGTLVLCDHTGFDCPAVQGASRLSVGTPLAQLLLVEAHPLEVLHLGQRLSGGVCAEVERAWLAMQDIQLWVPLVFKGELRGLLLLGGKKADDVFDAEDMRILETLAHQAALAAENVRLLESLRRRVDELVRLRDELEVTHRRLLTGREEERNRLSRELHDGLLQALFAINMSLQSLEGAAHDALVADRLDDVRQQVLQLADETRRICAELRPPVLGIMGLADAIRSYTEELAERRGNTRVVGGFRDERWQALSQTLTISLDLDHDRKQLPEQVAIVLFRVYQEALTNVEKHAEAKHVWVEERLVNGSIRLTVRDDGCGFSPPAQLGRFARRGHFGLLGIHERMAAVGGGAQILSELGAGTELRVWAPIEEKGSKDEHGVDTRSIG
jgi:signal transduction histidine kinase